MAFPHPKSRKDNYRNGDKPNNGGRNLEFLQTDIASLNWSTASLFTCTSRAYFMVLVSVVCVVFCSSATGPLIVPGHLFGRGVDTVEKVSRGNPED